MYRTIPLRASRVNIVALAMFQHRLSRGMVPIMGRAAWIVRMFDTSPSKVIIESRMMKHNILDNKQPKRKDSTTTAVMNQVVTVR